MKVTPINSAGAGFEAFHDLQNRRIPAVFRLFDPFRISPGLVADLAMLNSPQPVRALEHLQAAVGLAGGIDRNHHAGIAVAVAVFDVSCCHHDENAGMGLFCYDCDFPVFRYGNLFQAHNKQFDKPAQRGSFMKPVPPTPQCHRKI